MTRRTTSGKVEKVRQPKAKARLDEVKNPTDGTATAIAVPEKKRRSW